MTANYVGLRRDSAPSMRRGNIAMIHPGFDPSMADQIRYDLLTQQALRGVVRSVLTDTAKKGLPGDHHFYISFDTRADGVRLSDRLRAQYPDEMTIILQHQFWDLKVGEEEFEVGLSFGGIPERLTVPFDAINGFFDPSVQFGLQFEEVTERRGTPGACKHAGAAHDEQQEKAACRQYPGARRRERAGKGKTNATVCRGLQARKGREIR